MKHAAENPCGDYHIVYLSNSTISYDGLKAYMVNHCRFPEVDRYIFLFTDITSVEKKMTDLRIQATTDSLTGIYNRTRIEDSMKTEIQRAVRYKSTLSLIMFDIDYFKNINDNYGHEVGDNILIELSSLVREDIREYDVFARWGGEEFMIMAPNNDTEHARQLAEKLRQMIENHLFQDVGTVHAVLVWHTQFAEEDTISSFTKRADEALYDAKRSGRNKVCIR